MMRFPALALAAALLAPVAAAAQTPLVDRCAAETCRVRLTPDQLLGEAQSLILAGRFDEAEPMLAALKQVPSLTFETRFLSGMAAAGRGDHAEAARYYRAILADDPSQTRVRLELGKAYLAMGKTASADRQFAIAQQDGDLPDDVARTIRAVRDVIRQNRAWRFNVDVGIAPDSNINNATSSDTVSILWGSTSLPLTLDEAAKPRSGTGQTATISAGLRLPLGESTSMLVDVDTSGTNYAGTDLDDYQLQVATGPELRLTRDQSLSVQAVGAQRWYGGSLVSRQAGVKLGYQRRLSDRDQIGVLFDARRTDAKFDDNYDGWQTAAYATYERAIAPALVVSGGVFLRRDWLKADAYSSVELGGILGVGGELPMGITFGVSGTVSRADYDAELPLFSLEPRSDWRYSARATLGNRKISVLGFSPQVSVSFSRIDTHLDYYRTDRLRMRFAVARYF